MPRRRRNERTTTHDRHRPCRATGRAATPGRRAYEDDVRRRPFYETGEPRVSWDALPEYACQSWERNPFWAGRS